MDLYVFRKQMIHSKIVTLGITENEYRIKRMVGVIIKFQPTDEELNRGLKIIKNASDRYMVKSLEGFTFKVFSKIQESEIIND